MRLFAAVYPSSSAVADLEAALADVRSAAGFRWSATSQWHVTLAFLGDVRDEVVPSVAAAIDAAVADEEPFRLSLRAAGRFAGRGGTVVWAGLDGDVSRLVSLSGAVGAAARAAGATYPDRRPAPHLTLGRETGRGRRGSAERVLAALADYAGPPWDVTEVHLVRSTLGPPLRHESIHRWPLRGRTA